MRSSYNMAQTTPPEERAIDIKLEASPSDVSHSLLYSPTQPLRPSSLPVPSTIPTIARRRHTNSLSPKRPRPYPSLPRDNCNRSDDLYLMATSPDYSNWSTAPSLARPRSRMSSSLSNAMGDVQISTHSRAAGSPTSRDHTYLSMNHDMGWMPGQQPQQIGAMPSDVFPGVAGLNITYTDPSQYASYPSSLYRNNSPDSLSPHSPPFTPPSAGYEPYNFPTNTQQPGAMPLPTPQDAEAEIQNLRRKVRELQMYKQQADRRARELETQIQLARSSSSVLHGLPSPIATPVPSAAFQRSWDERTEARIRMFCSLNRAGNALCAWHDSRRERRAYPPRMAPPGYLNCGCSYEEALFEESLARHHVGSYHPGETVRMDPALRNPLLKLLQQRYGYRDGDFERDPVTGEWIEGEGHLYWQQKAQAGPASSRKARSDR